jgi:hypothetical protein
VFYEINYVMKQPKKTNKKNKLGKKENKIEKKQKENISKKIMPFIDLLKRKKGFAIAIIFFIILVILVLFSSNFETGESEGIVYSRAISQEIDEYSDFIIEQAKLELVNIEEPLDKHYLESIIDDMEWLKQKNNEILSNRNDLMIRMAGFVIFHEQIMLINEEFSFEIIEPDYDLTINMAKEVEFNKNAILFDDLEELSENEIKIFNETIDRLLKNYYAFKQEQIKNSIKERQYVESKKIIFLFN